MKQCALDHNKTKENYLLGINTGVLVRTMEPCVMRVVTLAEHMHTERQVEIGPKSIIDTFVFYYFICERNNKQNSDNS